MNPLVVSTLALSLFLVSLHAPLAAEPSPSPRFQADGPEFSFDTGVLTGKLRAEKRGFGLTSVRHKASGAALSRGTGLLGVYRVFGNGERFGSAGWDWPSEAALQPDGSVEVRCAATPERPLAFTGRYRWVDPSTVELAIEVRPEKDLRAFEAFVSSYFDPAFTNALAYVRVEGKPGFVRAAPDLGDWLMFPRDSLSVAMIQDGRWTLPPNPVAWKVQRLLAAPLAVRRAPGARLTAAVMGRSSDVFAVSMPFETEGHYSCYLSTFGRDLKRGVSARTVVRLRVLGATDDRAVLEAYSAFSNADE